MLETITPILWACFTTYATWYLTSAKHYVPITVNEAKILWKIHRQNIRCNARNWREIKRRGKIIGFECGCGYKHIQKRPISSNSPQRSVHSTNSETPILDKLHAPYKSR